MQCSVFCWIKHIFYPEYDVFATDRTARPPVEVGVVGDDGGRGHAAGHLHVGVVHDVAASQPPPALAARPLLLAHAVEPDLVTSSGGGLGSRPRLGHQLGLVLGTCTATGLTICSLAASSPFLYLAVNVDHMMADADIVRCHKARCCPVSQDKMSPCVTPWRCCARRAGGAATEGRNSTK